MEDERSLCIEEVGMLLVLDLEEGVPREAGILCVEEALCAGRSRPWGVE